MFLEKFYFYKKLAVGICAVTIFVMTFQASGVDMSTIDFQKIEPNKVPDELVMLSSAVKANFDKIKTWQGKISFHKVSFYRGAKAADMFEKFSGAKSVTSPNELGITAIGTTEFKIDLGTKLLYQFRNRDSLEFLNFDNSESYTSPSGRQQRTIINTPEYEIRCSPNRRKKDGTITSRFARKHPSAKYPGFYSKEDPRTFFYILSPPWEFFSRLFKIQDLYREGAIDSTYEVILEKAQTAENTIYRFQLLLPESGEVEEEIILDGAKGFNVTYVKQKHNGKTTVEITRDFTKIDGIYLPIKEHELRYDREGFLRHEEDFTLSDMQINMAIPANTFSIHNLGLKDSDSYIDEIENKTYKYQAGELVLEEQQ